MNIYEFLESVCQFYRNSWDMSNENQTPVKLVLDPVNKTKRSKKNKEALSELAVKINRLSDLIEVDTDSTSKQLIKKECINLTHYRWRDSFNNLSIKSPCHKGACCNPIEPWASDKCRIISTLIAGGQCGRITTSKSE